MLRSGRVLVLLAALALFPACGDDDAGEPTEDATEVSDDLTTEEQDYADAFAAQLADDTNGFPVQPDEADCMATAIMAELGVEPFEDADVAAEDIAPDGNTSPGALLGDGAITTEQAYAILDAWEDCVDLVEVLVESAGSELDLDPDGKACLTRGLGEDNLAAGLLAGSFTSEDGSPDDDTTQKFVALLDECSLS